MDCQVYRLGLATLFEREILKFFAAKAAIFLVCEQISPEITPVYRAHLRSFSISVKMSNDVYFFSHHGLFQQFDGCRMGIP